MLMLLILLSWIPETIAVCPYLYAYHLPTRKCYKEYRDSRTFFAASDICHQAGAALVSTHSAFENDYVTGLTKNDDHWLGLTNMMGGKGYTWLDGTPFDYYNWNFPQFNGNCAFMLNGTGKWESGSCRYFLPFVCEYDPAVFRENVCPRTPVCTNCSGGVGHSGNVTGYPPVTPEQPPGATTPPPGTAGQSKITAELPPVTSSLPPTTTEKSECPDGWKFFKATGFCYLVGRDEVGVNNTQAQKLCADYGAQLASIHSNQENAFIVNLSYAAPGRTATAWIGVSRAGPNAADFVNYDKTTLDYKNWSPVRGQPDNHEGNEYCVMMYINSPNMADGEWNDRPCTDYPYAYICKKISPMAQSPPAPVETTPTVQPKCDEEWKFFDHTGFCYHAGSGTNYTHMEAQTLCKNQNSHLASIHNEAENDFVLQSINELKLEHNKAWIGLHRKDSDVSVFENEDGTTVDYTNWLAAQPDRSDETCAMMYLPPYDFSGKWNDVYCTSTAPSAYICKKVPS